MFTNRVIISKSLAPKMGMTFPMNINLDVY